MRELKFRVWSEDQKTYDYKFPYNSVGDFYVSSSGVVYSDFGSTITPEVMQKAFIVEQYTGLKDKNGKEIYEGDVVDVWIGGDKQDTPYVVEDMRELYSEFHHDDGYYQFSKVEIVGNIHENPELVGGEEEE